ncbi:PDZ domain-containing protein [Caenorhabditis elegans]|nr:PDZ domain-containing protein [Caenorhabditis elegans]CAA86769.5 PDZ domain-containing protein [Caenorhabditis elegans]|eukprot:NP_001022038.2 Multiple PDZ domain protein [Caenorhabditis elegans]
MPLQSEEERIREVLRELKSRKEGGDVKEDIERIERILKDPLFKQLSHQPTSSPETFKSDNRRNSAAEKRVVEISKRIESSEIRKNLKQNQKLLFIYVDAKLVDPVVLETKEKSSRLLVVGPKDVKNRSTGKLRIGDCVVAIDASGGSSVPSAPSSTVSSDDTKGAAATTTARFAIHNQTIGKSEFETACHKSISAKQHLVVGVIREATPMVLSGDWTQVEVIHLNTETGGLGFGIVGGTSTGVVVKTILPGSPADKDGRLQPGDHILQIGNINSHGMSSQQVATILRHQHPTVDMIVGRPIAYADKPIDTPECFTLATKAALCATTLEEALQRQMATSVPSTTANQTPNTLSPSISCVPIEEEKEEKEPEPEPTTSKEQPIKITTYLPDTIDIRKPCDCAPNYNRRDKRKSSCDDGEHGDGDGGGGCKKTKEDHQEEENEIDSKDELGEMVRSPTVETGQSDENSVVTSVSRSSKRNSNSITSRISLKSLQEMALTVFLRENWESTKFELIDVALHRDPALGLGITVAGYVHKKEEIGGIFVKSLVPRSAASSSGVIKVHDLILEVNGTTLEHMSHADSVRTLVKSGDQVKLKLVRFPLSSPQAQCLKMLQQQETETQVIDVKLSNPDLVKEWKSRIGDDIEIIAAVVKPDRQSVDGGLGISLEGTVDVLNGAQLCPHHYIESIRQDGPVAKTKVLQAGDELLQVNHSPLYGESHVTVRQALTRAVHSGAPVTLIVARRSQHLHVFEPTTYEKQLPLSFPFLAANQETVVKAKSDIDLTSTRAETTHLLQRVSRRLRSKSLENFHGLAVWNCVPLVIHLCKDSRGLGFSIVDYKDPTHRDESVIVVQSLVPGGVAQADGRVVPGDRLLFVNNHDLSNSSLERAVAVLKAARMGPVRLGLAKPIPVDQSQFTSHSPLCSRSERLLARGRSPRGRRRYTSGTTSSQETVWIGTAEQYRKLHPQGYYPSRSPSAARSERSIEGSEFSMTSWSPCSTRSVSPCGSPISLRGSWAYDVVFLPTHLERTVKLQKGALPLGAVLDGDKDKGVNGCVVKSICGKKAVALDGRIQVGDFITKINTESLRNVTNSQARAILKRTNLVGTFCNVTYITSADAKTWKERFQRPSESSSPIINRLSPKVFPKFYRSPFMQRQESQSKTEMTDDETEAPSIMTDSMSEHIKTFDLAEGSSRSHHDEQEVRNRMSRLIDGVEVDDFVNLIIKEAITDATIELRVLHKTKDWSNCNHKREERLESPPLPPPPPEVLSSPPKSPVASVQPTPRDLEEVLTRSTASSLEYHSGQRTSQLHILSTEEEVLQATPPSSPENKSSEVPPSISPSGIKLAGEVTAPEEIEVVKEQAENVDRAETAATGAEVEATSTPTAEAIGNSKDDESTTTSISQQSVGLQTQALNSTEVNSNMSRVTSRTPSTGSESLQNQARQLVRSKYWGEARTVTLVREPNKSFGISIVGGRVEVSQKGGLPGTGNTVCGIFIKSVLPNSPAGRSGQMNMGDRVISVNDVDLRDATHEQAVNAIKNASNPVRFVLQSLHTNQQNMINSASNSTVGSVRFENAKPEEELPPTALVTPLKPMISSSGSSTSKPAMNFPPPSISTTTTTSMESESKEEEATSSSPDIQRENTVKRRSMDVEREQPEANPVEETSIVKEKTPPRKISAKSNSSQKESNDRKEIKKQKSVEREMSVESKKSVRSIKKHRQESTIIKKSPSNETAPLIVSDVSSSETHEDEPQAMSPSTSFDTRDADAMRALGIDDDSAAFQIKNDGEEPSKFFYTAGKIERKYDSDGGELVLVACERPDGGLGISLAGNKDRDKQNVFVVNVRPSCPLAIRPGDELLEINGRLLNKISHVAASAVVRECCDQHQNIEIVLRRRNGALNECAVRSDTITSSQSLPSPPTSPSTLAPSESKSTAPQMPTTTEGIENAAPNQEELSRKKSFSQERTQAIENGRETMIEIDKDGKGLGLSIVGGADTVLGTVVIHEVYSDGAAAHDGRLKPGDQVLEVNGTSLRGVTHDQSIAYLRRTPPKVRLLIYRDVNLQLSLLDPTQIYNIFEIDLVKKTGRGLGISIVGRKNEPGVYVSEIVKGGLAESDGRLMTGDQILEVNGKDVRGCMQEDVAAMLKTITGKVHLKLGRWKITETANRVHAATQALAKSATTPRTTENNNDPVRPVAVAVSSPAATPSTSASVTVTSAPATSVPEPNVVVEPIPGPTSAREERNDVPPPAPPMRPIITHTSPEGCETQQEPAGLSPVTEEPSSGCDFMSVQEEEQPRTPTTTTSSSNNNNSLAIDIIHDLKEEGSDTLLVELKKVVDQQLGMGIGKRSRGILVTSLQPGSAAAEKLKVGDRILAVNALPVSDQLSAVTFVKASGQRLYLQIARPHSIPQQ